MCIQSKDERSLLYEFARDRLQNFKQVLDCACGEGQGTYILASGLSEASCLGIDQDSYAIRLARERFHQPNLAFKEGNALLLSEPDATFDAVVSCHTIEHFSDSDQKRLLSELRRVLIPGGILIMATPDRDVWRALGIAGEQKDHIRELTKQEFINEVSVEGFKVLEVFGQNLLIAKNSRLRPLLNLFKKFDIFYLRRLLGNLIKKIDKNTQPISLDASVQPLRDKEKASISIIVAERS